MANIPHLLPSFPSLRKGGKLEVLVGGHLVQGCVSCDPGIFKTQQRLWSHTPKTHGNQGSPATILCVPAQLGMALGGAQTQGRLNLIISA